MAGGTSYSWIEGKYFVVSLCSSSCSSLSEDTNICVGFGYLAQFESWYIRFFHSLGFCLLNASLSVINAVYSSIKKTQKPAQQGWSGNEKLRVLPLSPDHRPRRWNKRICWFWCVPLFLCIFIAFISKRKKSCLITGRVHNRNQFRGQRGPGKINKTYVRRIQPMDSVYTQITCHMHHSF